MSISNYQSAQIGEASLHTLRATNIEAELIEADILDAVALRISGEVFNLAGVTGLNTPLIGRGGFPNDTVITNLRRQGTNCIIDVNYTIVTFPIPAVGYYGIEFPAGLLTSLGMDCSASKSATSYVELDNTLINDHMYNSFSATGERILGLNPLVAAKTYSVANTYHASSFFLSYITNT